MENVSQFFAVRGALLDFARVVAAPGDMSAGARFVEDGLLFGQNGHILWRGPWEQGREFLPEGLPVADNRGKLVVPGFVDAHLHYPQAEMVGSPGGHLLDWLNRYTFPAERKYADAAYARTMANVFIKELLRAGTTPAMVFCAVFPQSVDALFEEALARNMRVIAGKVMMDRNAPEYLLDTAESGVAETRRLVERWHAKARLLYAVTPRFAITSTPEQLAAAGGLVRDFPDVYLQTHVSENINEVAWVKELFPNRSSYLDVYDHYGLTGSKSVFAHSLHLNESEWLRLAETGSAVAFCPTSNLFLGSGLFNLRKAQGLGIRVGLGTDIGAGTDFCQLRTLGEAYKVMQMQGQTLSALEALYMATLGGAHALSLDDRIGSFDQGKEADFVVLNLCATPLSALRCNSSATLEEKLFSLMSLGDDRHIEKTYVAGCLVHDATACA